MPFNQIFHPGPTWLLNKVANIWCFRCSLQLQRYCSFVWSCFRMIIYRSLIVIYCNRDGLYWKILILEVTLASQLYELGISLLSLGLHQSYKHSRGFRMITGFLRNFRTSFLIQIVPAVWVKNKDFWQYLRMANIPNLKYDPLADILK